MEPVTYCVSSTAPSHGPSSVPNLFRMTHFVLETETFGDDEIFSPSISFFNGNSLERTDTHVVFDLRPPTTQSCQRITTWKLLLQLFGLRSSIYTSQEDDKDKRNKTKRKHSYTNSQSRLWFVLSTIYTKIFFIVKPEEFRAFKSHSCQQTVYSYPLGPHRQ